MPKTQEYTSQKIKRQKQETREIICRNILYAMQMQDLTPVDLAKMTGLSESTIRRRLKMDGSGIPALRIDELEVLCAALGLDMKGVALMQDEYKMMKVVQRITGA